jgi:hypothetical protein
MWKVIKRKSPYLLLCLLALFLAGANGNDRAASERETLVKLEQKLQARVKKLGEEQDFLLFQKEMYQVDSKYLVLNVTRKTGQLRYKSRVLKDFRFFPSRRFSAASPAGVLVLTKKTDGKNGPFSLEFGDALVLRRKEGGVPAGERGIPFIFLKKTDMQSIFMAVERGAMAYLVR